MFRDLAKTLYYGALASTGAVGRRIKQMVRHDQVAVLNLHRVSPEGSDFWPPLHPRVFEELLKFLVANFEVCDLHNFREVRSKRPIAILSFDDGYYDFVEYALPLMEKYRVRANLNVIPQCVLSGRPIWNVELYDFMAGVNRDVINNIDIPGFRNKLQGDSRRERLQFGLQLSRHLKMRPREEREPIWASIDEVIRRSDFEKTRMMTLEEVIQASHASDIGAHSFSHESMGYEAMEFFKHDLEKCRQFFDEALAYPLDTYAFPNGSYRPEQIDHLKNNGIDNVLLVGERFSPRNDDAVSRITMYGLSGREVKMKALGY